MITDQLMKYVSMGLAVLLIVASLSTWYFYNQFQIQTKAVATLQANIGELERNQKQKDEDIQLCNSRVDAFVKAAKLLEDKGIAAQKQASILAKKNTDLATKLLLDKQKAGEDSCVAAKRLVNDYLNERKPQ